MTLTKAINEVKQILMEENIEEDRKAGKYKKGEMIVMGQWPNPDQWAKEYIMPNVDKKGVRIYSDGPSYKIEKLQEIIVKDFFQFRKHLDEAKFAGSTIKMFGQSNRKKPIKKEASCQKPIKKEDTSFKVSIDGLPDMYMNDKTPGALLQKLRKIVKQPSMIKDVDRTTTNKVKKAYRDKAQGREVKEYKYDYGTPESVKLMKKVTPGEKEEGYVSMAQQRAVWANRKDGGKGHPDNKKKRKK